MLREAQLNSEEKEKAAADNSGKGQDGDYEINSRERQELFSIQSYFYFN